MFCVAPKGQGRDPEPQTGPARRHGRGQTAPRRARSSWSKHKEKEGLRAENILSGPFLLQPAPTETTPHTLPGSCPPRSGRSSQRGPQSPPGTITARARGCFPSPPAGTGPVPGRADCARFPAGHLQGVQWDKHFHMTFYKRVKTIQRRKKSLFNKGAEQSNIQRQVNQ